MDDQRDGTVGRRRALQLSAAAATTGLGGCLSSLQDVFTSGITARWQRGFPEVEDGPAVTTDAVYVVTADRVLGLDPADGQETWTTQVARWAAVSLVSETLFVYKPSRQADLAALTLGTHEVRWRVEHLNSFSPRVFDDGTVYVTASPDVGSESELQARDLRTGDVDWQFRASGIELPAGLQEETLYLATLGSSDGAESVHPRGAYAIDAGDGSVEWNYETETPRGPAVLDGDGLFLGTDTVRDEIPLVYALDAASGTERWIHEGPTENDVDYAWPVRASDDRVFVRTVEYVQALDRATGEVAWETRGDPAGDWALNRREGLLFLRRDRTLVAVTPDGTEEWTFTAPESGGERQVRFDVHEAEVVAVSGRTLLGIDVRSGKETWRFEADQPVENVEVDGREAYVVTSGGVVALALP